MDRRLIIIGAGGHGKVVADAAWKMGYRNIAFIDDRAVGECMIFPILGTTDMLESLDDGWTDFVMAVGDNKIRQKIAQNHSVHWVSIVHPSVQIGLQTIIGAGTVVLAGAVINPDSQIGDHCIINTGAIVEHDNVIKDYVHLSPRAVLGGTVRVGECTHVGIGATVKNNTKICSDCVIGAGAVVVKNITESGTYVGVPARKIK